MTDLDIRRPEARPYELGDRYRTGSGPVVLTGVQAIARALVEQHERDARAGLRVATFVSGYQGSPLGGVDKMLAGMPEVLQRHDITFVPGLNEELAATSVWGSQADLPAGTPTHEGVVGVWYGKGPGVVVGMGVNLDHRGAAPVDTATDLAEWTGADAVPAPRDLAVELRQRQRWG